MKFCTECPKHIQGYDPVPDDDDIFNMNNVYCVCSLLPNKNINEESDFVVDTQPYKIVSRGVRPYKLEDNCRIPNWCPLKKKKIKKRNFHVKKGRSSREKK